LVGPIGKDGMKRPCTIVEVALPSAPHETTRKRHDLSIGSFFSE
jgi:hypothetical protein